FNIECILQNRHETVRFPFSEHRSGGPFVSLNLNPDIDEQLQSPPFRPLEHHQEFFESYLGPELGELLKTEVEIKNLLLSNDCKATVIYLYCHGSNNDPFRPGGVEQLGIAKNSVIGPNFLSDGKKFLRGPIIILNSCSSGAYSPLSFSTFLSRFRE